MPEDLEAGSAITDSQAAEAVKQLNGGSTLEWRKWVLCLPSSRDSALFRSIATQQKVRKNNKNVAF